jgi:hypothetical protein
VKEIFFFSINAFLTFLAIKHFFLMLMYFLTLAAYFHGGPVHVNIITLLTWESTPFLINLIFFDTDITVLAMILVSSFSRMITTILAIRFIFIFT